MDGFEKPVINLHMHNYMIFDKGAKIIKKGKDNKMLPEKLDIFFRRINLDFYFILHINIWNQSVVLCPVQTVVPLPAYRFLKKQVRWSGLPICKNFPQFGQIYTVQGFGIVIKQK